MNGKHEQIVQEDKQSSSTSLRAAGDTTQPDAGSTSNAAERSGCGLTCSPSASVVVDVPGLAPKSPNRREHHFTKARRVRRERWTVRDALAPFTPPPPPWCVVLVRVAPRLLDDDNATAAMKATRDAIEGWLGVDDGDRARVRFVVEQERAPTHGVRIVVTHSEEKS